MVCFAHLEPTTFGVQQAMEQSKGERREQGEGSGPVGHDCSLARSHLTEATTVGLCTHLAFWEARLGWVGLGLALPDKSQIIKEEDDEDDCLRRRTKRPCGQRHGRSGVLPVLVHFSSIMLRVPLLLQS